LTHGLAPFVDAKPRAVRSSESGCADVQLHSLVPEGEMHAAVRAGRRATRQAIIGNEVRRAGRPADWAEVGNVEACRWLCYCKRGKHAAGGN